MARYDDLNTKMIAYSAVLSIVILVIILQGTQALCYFMVNSEDAKKESNKSDRAMSVKREQLNGLNGFKRELVVDEAAEPPKKGESQAMKKVIRIPIVDAQKHIIDELKVPATAPGT